mgnify:CR=1 FL=1
MSGTELILPNGNVLEVRDRRAVTAAEQRDPKGATLRPSFTSPTLPMNFDWNAEQAFRLGYAANVIAYRCVQLRANAIASVPLVAGRKQGDYKTINEKAPILKLLGPPPGGPAPKMSTTKLLRWTVAQEIVTGRRAWEIETDDQGRIVAFWPIAAANLRAKASDGGTEWFKVFETGPSHHPVKLRPDEVFYGWDPSGNDFRQAESPLQVARFDLTLVNLCDRYGIGFLRNNAVPSAVITTTKFPDEESKRRFLQNWDGEFQGPDNAGRVALNEVSDDGDGAVGDSIDIKVLGLSQKDARIVETRKEAMQELAIALGTPWSKLDASGRTFDNAAAEERTWWENTNLPDLVDLQDDINMQLAPRFGDDVVWFDLRGIEALQRRITPITQTVGAPSLVQAQLMTINEARADYGLDPVPGGDRMMTVDEIQALKVGGTEGDAVRFALTPVRAPDPEIPQPLELPSVDPDDDERQLAPAAESREADPEAVEQRRAKIWRASDAAVRALEGRWERAWRKLFRRQEEATIARLTGKRGRQLMAKVTDGEQRADPAPDVDPASIFDQPFWVAAAAELATDLSEEVVAQALSRLAIEFGIDFDLQAPWVADFINARANQLAGHVTTTTYNSIQQAMVDGVAAGESIDDIAARIRKVFAQASEQRAVTIARTEVISAYNGAATQGAMELDPDVVAGQEWIATRDGRTREPHAAADGQVVAIGEPFLVGGNEAAYPCDPALPADETVNCRCAVAFLTPDEMAEIAGRARPRVEVRAAKALLDLIGADTNLIAFRRSLTEVAA